MRGAGCRRELFLDFSMFDFSVTFWCSIKFFVPQFMLFYHSSFITLKVGQNYRILTVLKPFDTFLG